MYSKLSFKIRYLILICDMYLHCFYLNCENINKSTFNLTINLTKSVYLKDLHIFISYKYI